jgi:hypothetical protein
LVNSRFEPTLVAHLDEPVRRYFTHALAPGARLGAGVRLTMEGLIKVGTWMPFEAEWQGDGRSFEWHARAGRPFRPLRVVDRYAGDSGSMEVRLFGRIGLVRARGKDTTRSAAGRAAVEAAVWAPGSLLPACGVAWHAQNDERIVAIWEVPPERPAVHVKIDHAGAVRSVSVMRWDDGSHGRHGYIPCGAEVQAERRFGDLVLASEITVGWWFEAPRWAPFFKARVLDARPLSGDRFDS